MWMSTRLLSFYFIITCIIIIVLILNIIIKVTIGESKREPFTKMNNPQLPLSKNDRSKEIKVSSQDLKQL